MFYECVPVRSVWFIWLDVWQEKDFLGFSFCSHVQYLCPCQVRAPWSFLFPIWAWLKRWPRTTRSRKRWSKTEKLSSHCGGNDWDQNKSTWDAVPMLMTANLTARSHPPVQSAKSDTSGMKTRWRQTVCFTSWLRVEMFPRMQRLKQLHIKETQKGRGMRE